MKILLFVPTYQNSAGKLAMLPQTRESLDALDYGNHDVSAWVSVDDQPNRRANIMRQYERAWTRAKTENFDALLTVEHDMIIPPDALIKLADTDAAIVYGVYLFRESGRLNAFSLHSTEGFFDRSLDNHPEERASAWKAGVWDVCGAGLGCTLIRREVFERIRLRAPRGNQFPDLPLAQDTQAAGLRQAARFDVVCGHIRPDGFVLWPHADGTGWKPYRLTMTVKSSFTGVVDGVYQRFNAGEVVEAPGDMVGMWAGLGLVETDFRI